MQLGVHLRELWGLRLGVAVGILLACCVSLPISYEIGLFPPRLHPRSMAMASASTHVLIDTPRTTVLDLRQGTYEFEGMVQRAVLLGNVMASAPVGAYVARHAGVPAEALRISTPTTPKYPRPIATPQQRRRMRDLVQSTDEYRVAISANPTVPILDIYTQAPTAEGARRLANGSVDGLRDYLAAVARTQQIPSSNRVRLEQLGRAETGVITGGVRVDVVILAFLFVFGLSCAAMIFAARFWRGWRMASHPAETRRSADAGERMRDARVLNAR